ncbi:MAG: hypothetical protein J1E42_03300 [Akkermansiaceae bacterium]|nr:hypothetical protein [Akkermansiaceae bacterium]
MGNNARKAARLYYCGSGRDAAADAAALAQNPAGVVLVSPRLVALMKRVESRRPENWENLHENPAGADGWYIHLLAGDLEWARELAATLPPLPWLCYRRGRRDTRLRVLPWSRVLPHHHHTDNNT